jgi:hypothetical protein
VLARFRGLLILVPWGLLLGSACPAPVAATCNSDDECLNRYVCQLGSCVRLENDGGLIDGGLGEEDGGGDAGTTDGGSGDAGAGDGGPDGSDAGVEPDAGVDDGDGGVDAGPDVVDAGPPCGDAEGPSAIGCDPAQPGLAVCWDFEGVTSDEQTLSAVDTIGGLAARGTGAIVPGIRGDGYEPGRTGFLSLARAEAIVSDGPFSLEVWVFARSLPPPGGGRQAVFDSEAQFGLFLQDGGVACAANKAGTPFRIIAPGFPLNAWTHVACTIAADGAGLLLYVNGVEVRRGDHNGERQPAAADTFIGANSPTGIEQLDGVIDELRIFRARRSSAEICSSAQR